MRYMLAYMLEGDAKQYHEELSRELSERFKLSWVGTRSDPHLTVKAPFEMDEKKQLTEVISLLDTFTQKESPEPLMLRGFGDFRGKILYMDVSAPKQTHMLLRRLQDQLRNVSWLTFEKSEFPLTLHATLCRTRHPQQVKEMYAYLRKQKQQEFESSLDHIALLERGPERWQLRERFVITA